MATTPRLSAAASTAPGGSSSELRAQREPSCQAKDPRGVAGSASDAAREAYDRGKHYARQHASARRRPTVLSCGHPASVTAAENPLLTLLIGFGVDCSPDIPGGHRITRSVILEDEAVYAPHRPNTRVIIR